MNRDRILLIDDEPDIVTTWSLRLERMGFNVCSATDGQEGLAAMLRQLPDLVLLDVMLPGYDGLELCRRLKRDAVTAQIPVVLLTARGTLHDKLTGLAAGADDYITKDAEPAEIEARIGTVLKRYQNTLGANPLTKLPGTGALEVRLREVIAAGMPFAVGYADLNNFKAYNDVYGFVQGDAVIKHTAVVLIDAVRRAGGANDFIGHVGGDDFIFQTSPACAAAICRECIARLDHDLPGFYTTADRQQGNITTTDRQGVSRQFPLLSIAIAVVTNEQRKITSLGEVAQIAIEVKKHLKTLAGSNYAFDRRGSAA
jgi:diguanylate cyclase (GGDEF)-like protein